jgi:hypothetical protein
MRYDQLLAGHSAYGEPYEHIVELVNETGKDCV